MFGEKTIESTRVGVDWPASTRSGRCWGSEEEAEIGRPFGDRMLAFESSPPPRNLAASQTVKGRFGLEP